MTEEEFWTHYNELRAQVDNGLRDRAKFILQRSGAVDMSQWDDGFLLPKIIMTDALRHLANQWAPFSPKGRAELKNINHF